MANAASIVIYKIPLPFAVVVGKPNDVVVEGQLPLLWYLPVLLLLLLKVEILRAPELEYCYRLCLDLQSRY